MARQQGKAGEKAKGGKRVKVKKQPIKDLEAVKQVKGGALKRPGLGIVIPED